MTRSIAATAGSVQILDGLTVAIDNPGITCLIGPNGAGKTSTFNLLTGELPASAGIVRFQGNSITGGRVYRGPVEALRGQYIFADFISNNLWSFPISAIAIGQTLPSSQFILRNADFTPNAGTIGTIAAFGTDQAGNLYIVDLGGEIFRIEAT